MTTSGWCNECQGTGCAKCLPLPAMRCVVHGFTFMDGDHCVHGATGVRALGEGYCKFGVEPVPPDDDHDGEAGMTDLEHEAMDLSGKLANVCRKIIGTGPQAEHDWAEMAHRIHSVQHMILAQCAARMYPDKYRPLGGWVEPSSDEPTHAHG